MAFNSADTAAFKNVWVFCEQRQGVMMPTTFELISEGRKLANELGVELCGILLGDNVDGIAAELGEYGADKVYVYNSPLLKDFTTDAYTKVIVEAVEELKPEVLLFGASNIGRDLAPRCAARLHTGLCADCTHLDVDVANYIQHHMSEPITAEKIAEELFLSRPYLSRKFKEETGESQMDFILKEKTEEAKRLLRYSDKSLTAIGSYLGFSSASHFSRVFKTYVGSTPSEYREKHQ